MSTKSLFLRLTITFVLAAPTMFAAAYAQDAGAHLAMACGSCHGVDGRGGEAISGLAGRDETELLELMRTLRQPADGVTIMPRMLRAYDDTELKALASYFASLKP